MEHMQYYNVRPSSYNLVYKPQVTIVISTINHSYWSYKPTFKLQCLDWFSFWNKVSASYATQLTTSECGFRDRQQMQVSGMLRGNHKTFNAKNRRVKSPSSQSKPCFHIPSFMGKTPFLSIKSFFFQIFPSLSQFSRPFRFATLLIMTRRFCGSAPRKAGMAPFCTASQSWCCGKYGNVTVMLPSFRNVMLLDNIIRFCFTNVMVMLRANPSVCPRRRRRHVRTSKNTVCFAGQNAHVNDHGFHLATHSLATCALNVTTTTTTTTTTSTSTSSSSSSSFSSSSSSLYS